MHHRDTLDRRTALRALASGSLGALAGCLSGEGTSTTRRGTATSRTPTATGVFEDVFFEAQDMVIDLRQDAGVSQVNLIGPEGSKVTGASVPTGATRVRLQILDIEAGVSGYEHYQPGDHELVGMDDSRVDSMSFELRPSLGLVGVDQYRDGERGIDYGKLQFSVINTGTAPTWVYDISYRDAPNPEANDNLVESAGTPRVSVPEESSGLILRPDEERLFVDAAAPLVFTEDADQRCQGEVSFETTLGSAAGKRIVREISVSLGGEVTGAGVGGEYTCSRVRAKLTDTGENS